MHLRTILFVAGAIALLAHSLAHGHRQAERYIPIGQSPGVSGKTSHIGTVDAVDARARRFMVVTPEGRYTVQVSGQTRIWLDRSRQKQATLGGAFDDLQTGRRVEVKYEDADTAKHADWIKIEAP